MQFIQHLFIPAASWQGWIIAIPFAAAILVFLIGGAKWAGYLSPLDFTHGLGPAESGFLKSVFHTYWIWGTAQQIIMFTVFILLAKVLPTDLTLVLASFLFGMLHSPNILLVFACTGMGFLYGVHFSHFHNVWLVGFLHGLFATTLKFYWPYSIHKNLRIWGAYR